MLENKLKEFLEKGEVYLRVKARAGASSTEVRGVLESEDGETYKIDIAAIPEQGKANAELIKYLSKIFQVSKENFAILAGAGDKIKLVKIVK